MELRLGPGLDLILSTFHLGGLRRRRSTKWMAAVHVLVLWLLFCSAKHDKVRLRRDASEVRPPQSSLDKSGMIAQPSSLLSSPGYRFDRQFAITGFFWLLTVTS